jgi:hypothetical protein
VVGEVVVVDWKALVSFVQRGQCLSLCLLVLW